VSPTLNYTLGRLGLFLLFLVVLLPTPLNFFVQMMIAFVLSAVASFFVLTKWRNQMAERLGDSAANRKAEKERLRAALAGDESAAAAGDRVDPGKG
jgi:hypothetical protein